MFIIDTLGQLHKLIDIDAGSVLVESPSGNVVEIRDSEILHLVEAFPARVYPFARVQAASMTVAQVAGLGGAAPILPMPKRPPRDVERIIAERVKTHGVLTGWDTRVRDIKALRSRYPFTHPEALFVTAVFAVASIKTGIRIVEKWATRNLSKLDRNLELARIEAIVFNKEYALRISKQKSVTFSEIGARADELRARIEYLSDPRSFGRRLSDREIRNTMCTGIHPDAYADYYDEFVNGVMALKTKVARIKAQRRLTKERDVNHQRVPWPRGLEWQSLPWGLGLAKLSFTLEMQGFNVGCLDSRMLGYFAEGDQKLALYWTTAFEDTRPDYDSYSALATARYQFLESGLEQTPFFNSDDPLAYARGQWKLWEFLEGRVEKQPFGRKIIRYKGFAPATHDPVFDEVHRRLGRL